MNLEYVKSDRAYEDWRKSQPEGYADMEELLVKRHINDALERMVPATQWRSRLALINIRDYHGLLPKGHQTTKIVMARIVNRPMKAGEFVEWVAKPKPGCDVTITINCDSCGNPKPCDCASEGANFIIDLNSYIERINYDDSQFERSPFVAEIVNTLPYARNKKGLRMCNDEFQVILPAENYMFAANHYLENCQGVDFDTQLGYRVEKPHIILNFKYGQILMAYRSRMYDDKGWHMVPDDARVYLALRDYIDTQKFLFDCKYGKGTDKFSCEMWQAFETKSARSMSVAYNILKQSDPDVFKSMWRKIMNRRVPEYNMDQNLGRRTEDFFDTVLNMFE